MHTSLLLQLAAGLAGLLIGPILVGVAPRLVAYRLTKPPPPPGLAVFVPLVGGRLARWWPRRTFAFEVALIGVYVALSIHYGAGPRLILAGAFTALLFIILLIDMEHRLVLNRLSYPGVVLALALSVWWPGLGLLSSFLGAVASFGIFLALELIGRGRLGHGDTMLAALIGAMRGLPASLGALYIGVLLGGLGALVYLFVLRRSRKEFMPYGPYLAAGAILSFFVLSP